MRFSRLAKREQLDAGRLLDLEASRDEQQLQPDADCDDDQQLICPDGRRSPRRWFLPSPQGGSALNACNESSGISFFASFPAGQLE